MHGEGGNPCYDLNRIPLGERCFIILSQNGSAIPNDVHVHACKASLTLHRVYLHKRKIFGNPNHFKYRLWIIKSSPVKSPSSEETLVT